MRREMFLGVRIILLMLTPFLLFVYGTITQYARLHTDEAPHLLQYAPYGIGADRVLFLEPLLNWFLPGLGVSVFILLFLPFCVEQLKQLIMSELRILRLIRSYLLIGNLPA